MTMKKVLFAAVLATVPAGAFAQDWTGPYAGFQIGGSDINVDNPDLEGDGPSYGIYAGYNVQNGGVVYGGEFDFDSTEYDIDNGSAEIDSTARLKGRIGADVGGGLLYGTAGIVWATSPELGDDNGYFFGAGYDMLLANNVTVGAEVLQHQFDDYNDGGLDVDVTTLKLRVGFTF